MNVSKVLLILGASASLLALGSTTPAASSADATQLGGGIGSASGRLTLLRVHDVGTQFGPPGDQIDVEVVIRLDTDPTKAFGFQLRDDANRPARQAMVDLLRDAFANDWTVSIDYLAQAGRNNSVLFRVWLSR